MAGFASLPATASVLHEHDGLDDINERLRAYQSWHDLMDSWVVLRPHKLDSVYMWRLQAEKAMIAAGRPGSK